MTASAAPESLSIHLIAVGGSGMAPLACLLAEAGHRVRGSDGPLYPPMSTLLADCGIVPLVGYDAAHLDPAPDLVVVGNAVRRDNPEALEAERRGLPVASMPETLARFFLAGRRPLVVAGTHGKTTTSAIAAWVLSDAGRNPGFLIGGLPRNFRRSFRAGGGDRFVVEGDEYNAAYFDRGPKFLHYRPETLILTSVEYDHADLYESPAALVTAYERLIDLVPPSGRLVAFGDSPEVREVVRRARCPVVLYGLAADNDLTIEGEIEPVAETAIPGRSGSRFRVRDPEAGVVPVVLPMVGRHNVTNALSVWAAARADGVPADAVARALGRYAGVARRQDELGTAGGVTVVDDFAHHPTAVETTLHGLRHRYPGRRLIALFEPRSLTAGRAFFADAYARSFRAADRVLIAPVYYAGRFAAGDLLDREGLARALTAAGTPADPCATVDDLLARALDLARPGDVFVTMSSGAFGGVPHRLLAALGERAEADGGAGHMSTGGTSVP
ncbi:MAG TPA: UDP-N-acetylmuramate--L-alanine ligase [Thermoanaerobaculia bacterium]|nr:UDP-N-acetylmuramate--L-alanine ligase [Thermoanaerobaculia bacterium]